MKRKFPQVILNFYNISVVYHLPRKSENFAWNINGRLILSTRKAIFPENGISSKVDQNSQTEFPNAKSAFHLSVFTTSRPFGLDRLLSYLPRKSRETTWNERIPGKFPCRIRGVPFTTTVDQQVFPSKW